MITALDASGNKYDRDRVLDALAFAADAHEGQMRKSGEPYI